MEHNKTIEEFYDLTDAEDYFEFFDLEYDKQLINVKRFHILKEYGSMIKTAFDNLKDDEPRLLDFLKFSLLRVYADYLSGHAPSAAEVWEMFKDGEPKGCLACVTSKGGNCDC